MMSDLPSAADIGREFVRNYYMKLSFDHDDVYQFYGKESVLSYDGHEASGQENIQKTVNSLGYSNCKARIHSVNGLYGVNDSLTLQVCGELSFNGGTPRKFLQIFVLCKQSTKKYYVQTDIFQWVDKAFCADFVTKKPVVAAAVAPSESVHYAPQPPAAVEKPVVEASPILSTIDHHTYVEPPQPLRQTRQQTIAKDIAMAVEPNQNALPLESTRAVIITENHVASVTQQRQPDEESICSFDEADNLCQAKLPNNGGIVAPRPISPTKLAFQHEMKLVSDRIAKLVAAHGLNRLTPINRLPLDGFCNGVFQVIGTMHSAEGFPMYIRVADGTMPNFQTSDKNIQKLPMGKWEYPSCNIDPTMNRILEPAVIDILCYDEFKLAAQQCSPGDIIHLCNLRVQGLKSFYFIKMCGNGQVHGRSFNILQTVPNVEEIETIDLEEDEVQDIKFPIPESVMGSPCNKRPRLDD